MMMNSMSSKDVGTFSSIKAMRIPKRLASSRFEHRTEFPIFEESELTEMITAIILNNIVYVRKLIENEYLLKVVDSSGHTYLHLSAYFNKTEITQLLIKAGLKVDSRDNYFLTPLHSACSNNASDVVRLLVERGADLNARDQNWLTPLHICAATNSLNCLNYLNRNPVYLNVADKQGATALHYSASKGYFEFTENLLTNGANAKLQDNHGRTCLHYSVIGGDLRTVQLILEQDIDINLKDNDGLTALHIACCQSYSWCVELLVNRGANLNEIDNDGMTALHHACLETSARIDIRNRTCEFLIQRGADLKAKNNLQLTPLHLIYVDGPVTDAYARLKLDFDCRDYLGRTPMHIACYKGHSFLIDTFIENGADIRARDKFNRIPLHYAVEYSQYKCVARLIEIDPNLIGLVDDNNCNSLHYAAEIGHFGIWSKLIEVYSNYDQKDNFGRSVPFYAAHSKKFLKQCLPLPAFLDTYNRNLLFYTLCSTNIGSSYSSLEFILSIQNLKLDINQRDIYGRTPLHYAYLLNSKLHVECLLTNYASLYIEDEKGLTPIHYLMLTDNNEELTNLIESGLIDLNQTRYKICLMQCAAYYGANVCLKVSYISIDFREITCLGKSV